MKSLNGSTKKRMFSLKIEKGRCRSWFITINHFTHEDLQVLKSITNREAKLVVFQSEIGRKKQVPHLHATISFNNQVVFNTVKEMFPRANIQKVKNLTKSVEYCNKRKTWSGIRYLRRGDNILIDLNDEIEPQYDDEIEETPMKRFIGDRPTKEYLDILYVEFSNWLDEKMKKGEIVFGAYHL